MTIGDDGSPVAIVVGVGAHRGLGSAIARRFAQGGLHVVLAGRTEERLAERAREITAAGGACSVQPTDVRKEDQVDALFEAAASIGQLQAVVFNPGANVRFSLAETETWLFEHLWRVSTFGGFLVARQAARRMVGTVGGSVLFTGATGSWRGAAGHAAFAAAKAGLRMVAQSLAREYGPQGLHVAHIVIDGAVDGDRVRAGFPDTPTIKGPDGMLDVDAVAETYWQVHRQPPSAWTFEIDLRPFKEHF